MLITSVSHLKQELIDDVQVPVMHQSRIRVLEVNVCPAAAEEPERLRWGNPPQTGNLQGYVPYTKALNHLQYFGRVDVNGMRSFLFHTVSI